MRGGGLVTVGGLLGHLQWPGSSSPLQSLPPLRFLPLLTSATVILVAVGMEGGRMLGHRTRYPAYWW